MDGSITLRSEEEQTIVSHFCYARPRDFNFSSNPTFTTGSDTQLIHDEFFGDPQTFITTVGLMDAGDNPVAVARLSQPIKKNYGTMATIKVNLTF